ncbi:hypothetical protein HNR46_000618 [Haloferula luteola]|uniref:Uncharacterized protein n=1 Tax=Haloferula luteola TaxID=595692 RepID=A0A840V419_9BACT|nr:hypothetical protein [Haloferula luteola]MBB5350394.1 hypothetical protein [Haloferula luteola]
MDTLKILLGATLALILGALIAFVGKMNTGMKDAPAEEIAKMRQTISEMEQEITRLQDEKERRTLQEAVEAPSGTDLVTRDEAQQRDEEIEARLKQLEELNVEAELDAKRAEDEAQFLTGRTAEGRDKSARRARVINDAMLIARVAQWQSDPNYGDFAVLDVVSPDNVQSGSVLAIRRNGGILGKLRVGEVTFEGAIANPVTQFGEIKPEAGDELILDEVVQLAN